MNQFYLKLVLSFFVGSIWITTLTILAEKFGSKIGGLIGGLPSTVVVSLFFIAWTQGSHHAYEATTVFPLAMSINGIFLIFYSIFVKKGVFYGIASGLLVWFCLQGILVLIDFDVYIISIISWIIIVVLSFFVLEKVMKVIALKRVDFSIEFNQIVFRSVFSGGMITFAVVMSKVGGPIFGGIFSSFPAVFLSTLVITAISVGEDFSRSLSTPLMISGLINCVIFSIGFRFFIQHVDVLLTTVMAYLISIISGFFTYLFIKKYVGKERE